MPDTSQFFILAGAAGYYNRGCEAIVRGTIAILRDTFTSPTFMTVSHYKTDQQFLNQTAMERDAAITHARMRVPSHRFSIPWFTLKALDLLAPKLRKHYIYKEMTPHLAKATAVLAVGGDNYSLDYNKTAKTCTDLDDLVISKNQPFAIWGASVGPFSKNARYEAYMAKHLRKIPVFARESKTIDYLASIGIDNHVFKIADPAFVMEAEAPRPELGLDIESGSIGMNLSPLMARFVCDGNPQAWLVLASQLIRMVASTTRRRIYLIPHVMASPANNDHLFLTDVQQQLRDLRDQVILVPPTLNAAELKWVIGRMDAFAGARTHSTIAAISSHVPTVSFGYSIKAEGINTDVFGHMEFCIRSHELTPEIAAQKLNRVIQERDIIIKKLENRVPEIQKSACKAGRILRNLISSASQPKFALSPKAHGHDVSP
ncbi:MAG: polysaccharide pyruvyl transferase family protein [Pirellulales bacterium]|nr:polysaccharide pyruvyl transferase family protein [Pirellulales bacterium]